MSDRYVLGIESTNPSAQAGVAIARIDARDGRDVLGEIARESLMTGVGEGGRRGDDLASAIERLASRLGIAPHAIERVGVSIGPGGYTSMRVAVATAKVICEATGGACVGVPTALAVAHATSQRIALTGRFGVALAGKGDTTHVTVYDAPIDGRADVQGRLIEATDLEALGVSSLVSDRYLPELIAREATRLDIRVHEPSFDAGVCAELALVREPVDPALLAPLYPREPDAVTQWRARHGG